VVNFSVDDDDLVLDIDYINGLLRQSTDVAAYCVFCEDSYVWFIF